MFNLFRKKYRILIIYSNYYSEITENLLLAATKIFDSENVRYEKLEVPGVFEIPAALSMAIDKKKYDGFLTLGCVIRGQTSHYDIVANESARAIMDLSLQYKLALGNGILTVDNKSQAIIRADIEKENRGGWAAKAVLRMLDIKKTYG